MRTRKQRTLKIKNWQLTKTKACICGQSADYNVRLTGKDTQYYPICRGCLVDRMTFPGQYILINSTVMVQVFDGETEPRTIQIDRQLSREE